MYRFPRFFAILSALLLSIGTTLTACRQTTDTPSKGNASMDSPHIESSVTPETLPDIVEVDEPSQGSYETSGETLITLSDVIEVDGTGATAVGTTVTVTKAGRYLVSGTCTNGQIVVDTADDANVTVIFNGASLSCQTGPAVYIKSAPKKVIMTTADGSVNILSDGTGYVVPDEEQVEGNVYPNACIYACDDLTLEGQGTLYIKGNADKGINTKDDLKIKGGTVIVTSVGVGMRGNDSVAISGGTVTVTAGADGIKSANTEVDGKGFVTMENGTVYILSTGDGLSAATDLTVSGGTLVITTKDTDGTTAASVQTTNDLTNTPRRGPGGPGGGMTPPGGFGGGGMGGGMMGGGNANKSTISAKGLKAAGTLTISGGKMTIVSADDGVHSDDAVLIQNGSLHITANDDGVHADNVLTISGGVTEIVKSYEGIEANQITISGGTQRISASDDGTNANGGSSMGGWGGPWGGASEDTSDTDQPAPLLTISGGYTVLYADGDGIDSNGNIVMTGGTLYVYGPTNNGNGPIDYGDGNYNMTISGGTFLAVGSSGMADTAQNNGQAVLAARMNTLSAGDLIGIQDADGHMIAAFELPKAIASIVYSSPALSAGETYTFVYGGTAGEDIDGAVSDLSTCTGYTEIGSLTAY